MHCGKRQIRVFCLKSHHIITVSRQRGPTAVLPASLCPGTELQPTVSWQTAGGYFPHRNSALFNLISKIPHTTMTVFCSCNEACRINCWIFLFHNERLFLSTFQRTSGRRHGFNQSQGWQERSLEASSLNFMFLRVNCDTQSFCQVENKCGNTINLNCLHILQKWSLL